MPVEGSRTALPGEDWRKSAWLPAAGQEQRQSPGASHFDPFDTLPFSGRSARAGLLKGGRCDICLGEGGVCGGGLGEAEIHLGGLGRAEILI